MADRVGVINKGRILLVDDKAAMMARLGRTEAHFALAERMVQIPSQLESFPLSLEEDGMQLVYRGGDGSGKGKREIAELAQALTRSGIKFIGLDTRDSSLEDIFVDIVHEKQEQAS